MNGAANDSNVFPITAAHTARQGASRHADTSLLSPETSAKGKKSTPAAKVRADALRMLGCVRIATVRQMAEVITAEDRDGRSYVRRAMKKLAELGLAETNGKDGKHQIWNLTPVGQKADGNELPPHPKAGTGAKAVRAGFGPHGVAVTDMILAFGPQASDRLAGGGEPRHQGHRPELHHRRRPRAADQDQRDAPLRARQRHHVPGPPRP
ncbi:replication-relaxation family protein [Streptomyces rishiriensis]|uniref:replication-relaxation family protein n=1 Tax=Streptomyces rishiriensis TaxID=68264 RepID=UPI002481DCC7